MEDDKMNIVSGCTDNSDRSMCSGKLSPYEVLSKKEIKTDCGYKFGYIVFI